MKIKFVPGDLEIEVQSGQTVMDAAQKNGVVIRATCNGMPSCAECRVRVVEGDYNCNPPSRKELSLIGTGYYIDQRRLSCQLLCFGDITVDTTEQIEKASEGPVTKKFLTKVHKSSAQESHSLGGVLIEQDGKLLQELKSDGSTSNVPSDTGSNLAGLDMNAPSKGRSRSGGGGGGRGGDRGRGRDGKSAGAAGGAGGPAANGGRRRRRGGRNRR